MPTRPIILATYERRRVDATLARMLSFRHDRPDALVARAFIVVRSLLPHSPARPAGAGPRRRGIGARDRSRRLDAPTPAMFSGTLLAATSGLAFGAVGGAALSLVGALLGGLVAFTLARSMSRSQIEATLLQPGLGGSMACSSAEALCQRSPRGSCRAIPATGLLTPPASHPSGRERSRGRSRLGALLRTTPYAVLGQGIGSGSLATIAIAAVSIVLGGLAAALLMRQLRCRHPCERADLQDRCVRATARRCAQR